MIDIEKFKPDETGKYSPLLYKWLKSKRFSYARQVFQTGSLMDRSVRSEHWRPREIIIGEMHADRATVIGRNLGDIICGARGVKSQGYAYGVHGFNVVDITDQFWAEYERIGRCAWDHSHSLHMIGSENRWHYTVLGQRECNWCGHVQDKLEGKWVDYNSSKPSEILHPMGSMGEEC